MFVSSGLSSYNFKIRRCTLLCMLFAEKTIGKQLCFRYIVVYDNAIQFDDYWNVGIRFTVKLLRSLTNFQKYLRFGFNSFCIRLITEQFILQILDCVIRIEIFRLITLFVIVVSDVSQCVVHFLFLNTRFLNTYNCFHCKTVPHMLHTIFNNAL